MVSFGSVVAVLSTALPRSARHLDAIRATFGWPFPFRLLSPSRSVRPSTGHMRPSYDLTCIFEFALVGIVNTLGMPRKDPFAHGNVPGKASAPSLARAGPGPDVDPARCRGRNSSDDPRRPVEPWEPG